MSYKRKSIVFFNFAAISKKSDVETFLRNMFNDKFILSINNPFIRKFLSFCIAKGRKAKTSKNYELIGYNSSLIKYTLKVIDKVKNALGDNIFVTFSMRYTAPYSIDVVRELKKNKIEDITLFPLYPQYSVTTTKSSLCDFYNSLKLENFSPNTKIINSFYSNESYNISILNRIKEVLRGDNPKNFDLIFSAHSLPQKIIDRGDVYEEEVNAHVKILSKLLKSNDLNFREIYLAYQSKIGPIKWLKPYFSDIIANLSHNKVIIVPLSFVIDNYETDFELNIYYKGIAKQMGISDYRVARCSNDSNYFIEAIVSLL